VASPRFTAAPFYDAFGFKESDKFLAGDDIAPLVMNGDA
jgi:hypothetical protein